MAAQHRFWCGIALTGILLNGAPASAVAAEPSGGESQGQPTWLSSAGARPQPEAVQPSPPFQRQQEILRAHELLAQAGGQRRSPYPPEVLEWQHQVNTLRQQGKYQEAAQIQEKELAWTEQNLGPGHPDTALSLNNLAELFRSQGAYAKAEPLYIRALAIREKALGSNHPSTIKVREDLEQCRKALGNKGAFLRYPATSRPVISPLPNPHRWLTC